MIRDFPEDKTLERLKSSIETEEIIYYSISGEVVEATKASQESIEIITYA